MIVQVTEMETPEKGPQKERQIRYGWRSPRRRFWSKRMQIIIAAILAFIVALILQRF